MSDFRLLGTRRAGPSRLTLVLLLAATSLIGAGLIAYAHAPREDSGAGERAPFQIDGDVVHVNNRLCAVSRTPMRDAALGIFVSRVRYQGDDPRFAGKTLLFNQCCAGCVESFPRMWNDRADEILRFHGLAERTKG